LAVIASKKGHFGQTEAEQGPARPLDVLPIDQDDLSLLSRLCER
jgi:hypothetical protein